MAYRVENLNTVSSGKNSNVPTFWIYSSTVDDFATISSDGYFQEDSLKFQLRDLLYVSAPDRPGFLYIKTLKPIVTSSTMPSSIGNEIEFENGRVIMFGSNPGPGQPTGVKKPTGSLYINLTPYNEQGQWTYNRLYIAQGDGGKQDWAAFPSVNFNFG